jgi:hypothetical protein
MSFTLYFDIIHLAVSSLYGCNMIHGDLSPFDCESHATTGATWSSSVGSSPAGTCSPCVYTSLPPPLTQLYLLNLTIYRLLNPIKHWNEVGLQNMPQLIWIGSLAYSNEYKLLSLGPSQFVRTQLGTSHYAKACSNLTWNELFRLANSLSFLFYNPFWLYKRCDQQNFIKHDFVCFELAL